MLSNITWGDFFAGVFAIVVLYYLYVLVKFYPHKLKTLFSSKKGAIATQSVFLEESPDQDNNQSYEEPASDQYDEMEDVEELVASLVKGIENASEQNMVPGEFKQHLRMILREKPSIKNSPYRSSINQLIISECGKHGTITLSEKEVDALWEVV